MFYECKSHAFFPVDMRKGAKTELRDHMDRRYVCDSFETIGIEIDVNVWNVWLLHFTFWLNVLLWLEKIWFSVCWNVTKSSIVSCSSIWFLWISSNSTFNSVILLRVFNVTWRYNWEWIWSLNCKWVCPAFEMKRTFWLMLLLLLLCIQPNSIENIIHRFSKKMLIANRSVYGFFSPVLWVSECLCVCLR